MDFKTQLKNYRALFIINILTIMVFHQANGQSKIEQYLSEITEQANFSGSVLVSIKDTIIINKGFGFADYEQGVENKPTTVHRIGSLTKPITTIAVLKLCDDIDSLSIQSKLKDIIPNVPKAWGNVTIFNLLTHTSGISDYFGDLEAVPEADTFKEIEIVMQDKQDSELVSRPGESYRYNNFGYILLGRIIEIFSKSNYSTYLNDEIFVPLKMNSTFYDDYKPIIENRSEGYIINDGERQNDALKDPAAFSAGGILSTTEDLYKFLVALRDNEIVNQDIKKSIFEPFKNDYGLGWQIVKKKGKLMYNHNGSTHGYNSRIVYYPNEEVFIIVLGNNEDIRAAAITCDIEGLIFEKDKYTLGIPISLSEKQLKNFVGKYQSNSEKERELKMVDGELFYFNGNTKFGLLPLSNHELCFAQYSDIRLEFSKDWTEFVISTCSINPENYIKK